ncbi:MAG TPA: CvpA family protein [Acidimicrobiia bacterium]|nr:CvpA family protein [Acidimicrobiia bacterium]
MLDFVLGLYIAGLAVRGWLRGFVRELMDLVGLVVGAAVAFRLSGPFGGFLTDRFGVSPEWGRIGAGIVLFILFGVTLSVAAHFLSRVANLPGLSLTNRVLGAGTAGAWGVVLVLVGVVLLTVLPVPQSWDRAIEDSAVAQAIAGPDAFPRRLAEPIVGDRAVSALAAIERAVGDRRVVPDAGERVETEPVGEESLTVDEGGLEFVRERVNRDRTQSGADLLAWSDALGGLAEDRARHLYREGYVERRPDADVLAATRQTSLRLRAASEMVALASSPRAAHAGIVDADDTSLSGDGFTRFGAAVMDGPLGSLVVEIYGQ